MMSICSEDPSLLERSAPATLAPPPFQEFAAVPFSGPIACPRGSQTPAFQGASGDPDPVWVANSFDARLWSALMVGTF